MIGTPACASCKHLKPEGAACAAFDFIPREILIGENDHSGPVEGDHGVRYEAGAPAGAPPRAREALHADHDQKSHGGGSESFHGEHDQKSHGNRDGEAAEESVNRGLGKKPSTEGAAHAFMAGFPDEDHERGFEVYQGRVAEIRSAARDALAGKPTGTPAGAVAATLLNAISTAPATKEEMFRGTSSATRGRLPWDTSKESVAAYFGPGTEHDLALASFSFAKNEARDFARGVQDETGGHPIIFRVEPGARALDLSKYAGSIKGMSSIAKGRLAKEREALASGRFRVSKPSTYDEYGALNVTLKQISRSPAVKLMVRVTDFVPGVLDEILEATPGKGRAHAGAPAEAHGDSSGHPFRGNQWTDGQGGSDDSSDNGDDSEAVRSATDTLHAYATGGAERERRIVLSADGTILSDTVGTRTKIHDGLDGTREGVALDPKAYGLVYDQPDESVVDMHTHPAPLGPSDGDWGIFSDPHVKEMRVISNDGTVHIMTKTPAFHARPYTERYPALLSKRWNEIIDKLTDAPLGEDGNATWTVASAIADTNRLMAKEFGATFVERKRGKAEKHGVRFHGDHDQKSHGNREGSDDQGSGGYGPTKTLTEGQWEAQKRFNAEYQKNPEAMVDRYIKANTENGSIIISADEAKELSADYAKSKDSRSLLAVAVHETANLVAKAAFEKALKMPVAEGHKSVVLVTAGGPGSGKTTGSKRDPNLRETRETAHIVYDSTMSAEKSAQRVIDSSLAKGYEVSFVYTHRDPMESLEGVVKRGATGPTATGRSIPMAVELDGKVIGGFAQAHIESRRVAGFVRDTYKGKIEFRVVDNSRGPNAAVVVESIPKETDTIVGLRTRAEARISDLYRTGKIGRAFAIGSLGAKAVDKLDTASHTKGKKGHSNERRDAEQANVRTADSGLSADRGPEEGGQHDARAVLRLARGATGRGGQQERRGRGLEALHGDHDQKSHGNRDGEAGGAGRDDVPPGPLGFRKPSASEFIAARDRSARPGYLSPLTAGDLAGKDAYLSEDGAVGYVLDNDDLGNLFNNGGPKGAGRIAVARAIQQGAKTLDCFDGHLPRFYSEYGFEATSRIKFDPSQAPPGWNYERDDNPDVVFMAYRGGDRETIVQRAGKFRPYEAGSGKQRGSDYDQAKADQRAALGTGRNERLREGLARRVDDGAGGDRVRDQKVDSAHEFNGAGRARPVWLGPVLQVIERYTREVYGESVGHEFRGNQWTSGFSGGALEERAREAPIMKGSIDYEGNLGRNLMNIGFEAERLDQVYGRETPSDAEIEKRRTEHEDDLKNQPLVHMTQPAGAVAAFTTGLAGHEAVAEKTMANLKDIESRLHDMPDSGQFAQELKDLKGKAEHTGATFGIDKSVGLDRFVFMTHGAQNGIYGPIAVLIDPDVLDKPGTFATRDDIITVARHQGKGREGQASQGTVDEYQGQMVRGRDAVTKLGAAMKAGERSTAAGIEHTSPEIKAPYVAPRSVIGLVADSRFSVSKEDGRAYYDPDHKNGAPLIDWLVARGVPREKIHVYSDAKTEAKRLGFKGDVTGADGEAELRRLVRRSIMDERGRHAKAA